MLASVFSSCLGLWKLVTLQVCSSRAGVGRTKGWSIAAGILESTKCNAVEETQSSGFSDAQRVGAAGQGRSSAGVIPKLLERCRLMGSQCFWGNKNRDSYDTCHRESGSTTRTAPREPIYHP